MFRSRLSSIQNLCIFHDHRTVNNINLAEWRPQCHFVDKGLTGQHPRCRHRARTSVHRRANIRRQRCSSSSRSCPQHLSSRCASSRRLFRSLPQFDTRLHVCHIFPLHNPPRKRIHPCKRHPLLPGSSSTHSHRIRRPEPNEGVPDHLSALSKRRPRTIVERRLIFAAAPLYALRPRSLPIRRSLDDLVATLSALPARLPPTCRATPCHAEISRISIHHTRQERRGSNCSFFSFIAKYVLLGLVPIQAKVITTNPFIHSSIHPYVQSNQFAANRGFSSSSTLFVLIRTILIHNSSPLL